MRRTAFIGHRQLLANDVAERLTKAIRAEIEDGCESFTMGTHGQFDRLALNVCRYLRSEYDLDIEVVITSLNAIKLTDERDTAPYSDVKTVMYDIEEAHYKQRIILSNRQMIDSCDTLICYVDTDKSVSGAKMALRYAEKRGIKIINLFKKEDDPFYGLTREQIDERIKAFIMDVPIK